MTTETAKEVAQTSQDEEASVEKEGSGLAKTKKKRPDYMARRGYDKRKAFSKTDDKGNVRCTPILFKLKDESEADFQKRMETCGYLGPDKPKGHWDESERQYHMGENSKDCPYCTGKMPTPGTRRSPASKGNKFLTVRAIKVGSLTENKDNVRLFLYFAKEDLSKLSDVVKSSKVNLIYLPSGSEPARSSEPSSDPPSKEDDKVEPKEAKSKLDEAIDNSKPKDGDSVPDFVGAKSGKTWFLKSGETKRQLEKRAGEKLKSYKA